MKKALLLVCLILIANVSDCRAVEEEVKLPNIFIWAIPDDVTRSAEEAEAKDAPESDYINEKSVNNTFQVSEEEIGLDLNVEDVGIISASTLKGYAEYVEDVDSIYLKDEKNQPILNLKVPQKITSRQTMNLQKKLDLDVKKQISKYNEEEYKISGDSSNTVAKVGNFSFGTVAGYDVDTSMLEYETGLFTKYEKNKFALSSSYKKSLKTTYGQYVDTFSLTPEYRLNKILAVQEVFSADLTRNRKSGELVLKITPFGNKDSDRLNFELGAKQTMDETNAIYRTQFRFSTEFKL